MLPEPNFPARPDEFVGRRQHIEAFRYALQQGLAAGRTSSFAILGDWGIGKSSLLLKFAAVCSEPAFAILPVPFSASSDIHDYMRLAESLLDKFGDALLALVREFVSLGESEIPAHHLTGKIHRQYPARIVEKGLVVRTGRGRCKLYHPLFREFLRQT